LNPAYFLPPVPGVHRREALFVFRFALGQGMSWKRARVLACAASYGEKFWGFQRGLAEFVQCSVRTVQRAMDEAKTLGIIYSRRSRQGEIPPGMARPFKCGFAMRTFSAWGLRSTRRIGAVCARHAHQDMHRRMRAAENRREKPEIAAALAEFRALGP
jgi:hypothetical protein